ncbi:MAG: hypothetical protein M1834_004825 [Cirrosporium novae-zelandiae]|nr:MAG: hypothetical protein M1834_004825 [Cirrosporium novae-zelandiae]
METISNITSAASKAIWGDKPSEEPVSGESGAGTASDPYDKGNAEEPNPTSSTTTTEQQATAPKPSFTETQKSIDNPDTSAVASTTSTDQQTPAPEPAAAETQKPMGDPGTSIAAGGPLHPEHNTEKTGVTDLHSNDPKFQDERPTERNASGGLDEGVSPSVGAAPDSGAVPHQKQQGADRPSEAPTDEQAGAIREKKESAEVAQQKEPEIPEEPKDFPKDPNDHSGEPLDEVKHEEQGEKKDEESSGQKGESDKDGTGEKWEKTTGLAADGGNFDATKPGAAREADRLLAEKGIRKDPLSGSSPPPPVQDTSSKHADKADKPKLSEKLKDKLHIGKH